jgi:hypothetical protein
MSKKFGWRAAGLRRAPVSRKDTGVSALPKCGVSQA